MLKKVKKIFVYLLLIIIEPVKLDDKKNFKDLNKTGCC